MTLGQFSDAASLSLVPTLCVGTYSPTPCVELGNQASLSAQDAERPKQTFPRRAWEREREGRRPSPVICRSRFPY
jgi:hypothetical protein